MINNDLSEGNDFTFTLPIYKCPTCRNQTTIPWFKRPRNYTLIDILSKNEEYKKLHDEYMLNIDDKDNEETVLQIPHRVNLSHITHNVRIKKAYELYNHYLPILIEHALQGKTHLSITHPEEVKDILTVADILAHKFITENGIYRFISTRMECQIELVHRENMRFDYENVNYNTANPYTHPTQVDGSSRPPTPPTPSIDSNISTFTLVNENTTPDEVILNRVRSLFRDESLLRMIDSWYRLHSSRDRALVLTVETNQSE